MTTLRFQMEQWSLAEPFRFAGYTVTTLDIAHVSLIRNGLLGQGEGVVPIVFDVTLEETRDLLTRAQERTQRGTAVDMVCAAMPPGPARNALDCAIWDLRAKESGTSIWELAGLPPGPSWLQVDQTIGLDAPDKMAQAATESGHAVLKIKADAEAVLDRLRAVRSARPDAELIVDANQSWSLDDLQRLTPELAELGVAMIEQPVPRGQDMKLAGLQSPVPIFADESCHTCADLPGLVGLYQGINIKLDKTGGLTEALALARAAKETELGVMVGCMAGTSLSMAPAYVIGTLSRWSDLDGPLLLANDRDAPMTYRDGLLSVFSPTLWG